jgi:hypothetical protein
VEPEAIQGEPVARPEPEPTSFPAIDRARERLAVVKKIGETVRGAFGGNVLGSRELDPRATYEDPDTLVIFPLPLANIRRAVRSTKRRNTPVDMTAQLLSASELVDDYNGETE